MIHTIANVVPRYTQPNMSLKSPCVFGTPALDRILTVERFMSLEETNKIRISLGLKPLTDDKAPADNEEKQAEDNYAKKRGAEKAKESKYVLCCYSYASN